jgi:hypothetical protein
MEKKTKRISYEAQKKCRKLGEFDVRQDKDRL